VKGLAPEVEKRLGERAAGARVSRNKYLCQVLSEHVGLGEGVGGGPRPESVTARLKRLWKIPGSDEPPGRGRRGGRGAGRARAGGGGPAGVRSPQDGAPGAERPDAGHEPEERA